MRAIALQKDHKAPATLTLEVGLHTSCGNRTTCQPFLYDEHLACLLACHTYQLEGKPTKLSPH
jgi:hypothetical protein